MLSQLGLVFRMDLVLKLGPEWWRIIYDLWWDAVMPVIENPLELMTDLLEKI